MEPKEIFSIFKNLNSKQDVQNLFIDLNFEQASSSESEIDIVSEFIDSKLKNNIEYINLINEVDDFFIFFCKLKLPNLNKGRILQREIAKRISKKTDCIIVFSNDSENIFKITYVSAKPENNVKLASYTISSNEKMRTASEQIAKLSIKNNYSKADIIKHISDNKVFDIEPVTEEFFAIIKEYVDKISKDIHKYFNNLQESKAFALQFFNRILFLKYIEKKKWLHNNLNFLEDLINKYQNHKSNYSNKKSSIYTNLFQPLFFYSFSRNNSHSPINLPEELISDLEDLPYLNGGLFEKNNLDIDQVIISDELIHDIFSEIINKYNFTITEDTPFDREIAIDPEMLGLIYEGIVNAEERSGSGIFYTPRIEVDFMCKKSLLHFLHAETKVSQKKIINLIFSEQTIDSHSNNFLKELTLSERELIKRALNNIKVVDPACGSGAFLIGMLYSIMDIFIKLEEVNLFEADNHHFEQIFKLKKDLIEKSIHGVDIKPWATQIAELRLWLFLIGDYEGSLSLFGNNPILPSLDFKIRCGDSLLAEVEGYPVILRNIDSVNKTHPIILKDIKELKDLKLKYYYHDDLNISRQDIEEKEKEIIKSILNLKKTNLIREFNLIYDSAKVADPSRLFESPTEKKNNLEKFLEKRTLKEEKLNEELNNIENIINKISEYKNKNFFIWELDFADVFFEAQKGGFDIIIGNPPYVRQEEIAPPLIEKEKITTTIKTNYKNKLIENVINIFGKEKIDKFDKKSDYYVYFYFISLSILKENGIFTFINSSSWLDVGYGAFLQEFLLKYFKIIDIHDNSVKRSFKSADINTVIITIERPYKEIDVLSNLVRFINHKTDFENSIQLKNISEIYLQDRVINNESYRMIIKSQKELLEEGIDKEKNKISYDSNIDKYTGSKWGGKYLRAPDIYYKILEKGKGKLIPLKEIAEVRRGFTTGANEFFYLDEETIEKWKIEKEFLIDVLTSPQESKKIDISFQKTKYKAFVCPLEKQKIKGTNALKYIENAENTFIEIKRGEKKGKRIKGYNNIVSLKHKPVWYSIGKIKYPDLVWNYLHADISKIFYNNRKKLVNNVLYEVYFFDNEDIIVSCMLQNSTLENLLINVFGRANYGEGVLSLAVFEVKNIFVINPKCVRLNLANKLNNLFINFSRRDLKSIFQECGFNPEIPIRSQEPNPLPDRKELDDIIFDILGLTLDERKEVYWAVCELVQNRINKARSV